MKTLFAFLAALVLCTRVASAQDIPDLAKFDPQTWFKSACPSCGIKSAIDWVQTVDVDGVTSPVIAGWGFECVSGKPIEHVDTYAYTAAKGYAPVKTELRWQQIPRPDVIIPGCTGNVTSGFGAVIVGPLPEGTTKLAIVVRMGPYSQQTTIPVLTR